jgi:hypothetical protein
VRRVLQTIPRRDGIGRGNRIGIVNDPRERLREVTRDARHIIGTPPRAALADEADGEKMRGGGKRENVQVAFAAAPRLPACSRGGIHRDDHAFREVIVQAIPDRRSGKVLDLQPQRVVLGIQRRFHRYRRGERARTRENNAADDTRAAGGAKRAFQRATRPTMVEARSTCMLIAARNAARLSAGGSVGGRSSAYTVIT